MPKVASIADIRTIEAQADANGISYDDMMQRAGKAIATRAQISLKSIENPSITVLVGAGNNGGDGLVAGLLIAQDNLQARVRFYLLKDRPDDDPYIKIAKQVGMFIVTSENDSDKRLLKNMIASSDLIIDALFGIGVRLPLRDEAQRLLRVVNQVLRERATDRPTEWLIQPNQTQQRPKHPPIRVLAVDVPSGLDADSGQVDKNAIFADETITFIAGKHGLFVGDGVEAYRDLTIANLGIPEKTPALHAQSDFVVTSEIMQNLLPLRPFNSHKGTFGKALIIAGSGQYYGAPLLATEACYRVGAGLTCLATTPALVSALAPQLPETTWLSLPSQNGDISEEAVNVLQAYFSRYTACLVGCGLGNTPITRGFLLALLQHKASLPPLVLDADALNILAETPDWYTHIPTHTILTPHPTEMARLCGLSTQEIQNNRWQIAREKAQAWNAIVILKGAHTLIANSKGEVAVLPFKTPALAKAGTGDILAGMVAGFLAQGLKPFEASLVAGYCHGLAGQLCGQAMNNRAVLARDILSHISPALALIES
jgi:ADP-dependent NAD(P)H-hydrate dehydratase / NAD(P)H-hydrate epimerase